MHHAHVARSLPSLALAAALAASGCGGPEAEVGAAPAPSLEETLRSGQPARAIVLLDESSSLAALRVGGGGAEDAVAVLEYTKASLLSESSAAEIEVLQPYRTLPAMQVELRSPAALEKLLARPEVLRVVPDEPYELALAQSLPLIHQPAGYAAGATGQGTAVAVLDTGVDYTNGAFGTCPSPGAAGCKVAYAHDFAPDDGALDANGHGTNVAAIVAGVAPGTTILALDVFNGQYAYASDILSAIDWCVQNQATYNIVALNMSLGSGGYASTCPNDVFAGAIHTAKAAGILSAIASGNNGYSNMISSPACAPDAVSVGAVYDTNLGGMSFSVCSDPTTAADKITCFSNSASFLTVLAPGAMITAGGITMAGTSQASPHVAGAIAALKSLYVSDTPDQLVARLRSGPRVTDARNGLQFPRLDLGGLVPPGCVASFGPASAALSGAGQSVTLTVTAPSDCSWTATTGGAWLGLSPASGTGSGTVTVTAAANASAARSATVTVGGLSVALTQAKDTTLPTGDVTVVGGPYTRSLTVALVVRGFDPVGVTQMCILNQWKACPATGWRPFASDLYWTLASGAAGPRYVYVWLKDAAGNVNGPAATSIVFDNKAPTGGTFAAVKLTGAAALYWGNFTEVGSGVASYVLNWQVGSAPASCYAGVGLYAGAGTSWLQSGLARKVTYGFRVCPIDAAGNVGAGKAVTVRLP